MMNVDPFAGIPTADADRIFDDIRDETYRRCGSNSDGDQWERTYSAVQAQMLAEYRASHPEAQRETRAFEARMSERVVAQRTPECMQEDWDEDESLPERSW